MPWSLMCSALELLLPPPSYGALNGSLYGSYEALANPEMARFINNDQLEWFRGTGEVRIEDDVLITENGCCNWTKVPRTVQEIEDWIAGVDDDSKFD
ncbi:xaa-Pro dipeptidase-like [Atheta coriaria]|uniref:xaa-Pro dipeptidase-like n=1 Tax=Dalotia coriaria TaxID=877792 RepID=UPI0031F41C83